MPFAAGGEAVEDNLELRCRAHNAYEAAQYFGSAQPWLLRETGEACSSESLNSVRTELAAGARVLRVRPHYDAGCSSS